MAETKESERQAVVRQLLRERRTQIRFPCNLQASCYIGVGRIGTLWFGKVRDISSRGMRLVLPREFPADTVLTVKLYRVEGSTLLAGQVRVIFARNEGPGWTHGCQFLEAISDRQMEELTK
jgi:PilZ domain